MPFSKEPRSISDIPHFPRDTFKIEMMHPAAEISLIEGMLNMADMLNSITGGDHERECALGGLLFTVANRSAYEAERQTERKVKKA